MKNFKLYAAVVMLTCCTLFYSCGTTMNMGSKLKKIEIGMTKQEVINILGNTYDVVAARDTPDGTLEILRYTGMTIDGYYPYLVNFLDGKLVEWFMESAVPPY